MSLPEKVPLEEVPCDLCQGQDSLPLLEKYHVVKCKACGLVYTSPRPSLEALETIYGQAYFKNDHSEVLGYQDYLGDRPQIALTFEKRLKEIEKKMGRKGGLLDVGCATGFFMDVAQRAGWVAQGVELSPFASAFARKQLGLKVIQSSFSSSEFQEGSFDMITMWDYLEHAPSPMRELKKAWHLLKEGGLLVLTTPDIESWPSRLFKKKWMGYKPMEHLYYFSKNTIQDYLRANHFEVLKISYVGKYITLDFFLKRLSLYSRAMAQGLSLFLSLLGLEKKAIYINPWDIMEVYALKASS